MEHGEGSLSDEERRRLLRFGAASACAGGLAVAVGKFLARSGHSAVAAPVHAPTAAAQRRPRGGVVPAAAEYPGMRNARPDHHTGPRPGTVVRRSAADTVFLTFDDGPDEQFTPRVLAFLAEHHLHATFSLIGREVARYPDLARTVVAAGMNLTNHTWDHDEALASRPRQHMVDDIARAQEQIVAATGAEPGFFRAPGGGWSTVMLDVCAEQGLVPLGWDVDSRDWARPGAAAIIANVTSEVRPGSIMLFHDGGGDREETLEALPRVLRALTSHGYDITQLAPATVYA